MVHRRIREEREKHDTSAPIRVSGTPGVIEAIVMCNLCRAHASFRVMTSDRFTATMWLTDQLCPHCGFLPQWELMGMEIVQEDPLALHEGTIH